MGISPPSGAGTVIICIMTPNTSPATIPTEAPLTSFESMGSCPPSEWSMERAHT